MSARVCGIRTASLPKVPEGIFWLTPHSDLSRDGRTLILTWYAAGSWFVQYVEHLSLAPVLAFEVR